MPVSPRRSRSPRPRLALWVVVLVLVGLVPGALAMIQGRSLESGYAFLGVSMAAEPSGPAPAAEGTVRVLVPGRTIPAYAKLTRDDLWDSARGNFAYMDIDESLIESAGVLVSSGDLIGRVLRRDKKPGYVFTERDFLPVGTRPGFSAGIPPGKRALRVEVDRVAGIVGLMPGDRFDIVSAMEVEGPGSTTSPSFVGLYKDQMTARSQRSTQRAARVRALVQNGVVVSPLESRAVPITSSSITRGPTTKTIPVQEMIIALDPDEVAPFMEAIAIGADLQCLARSGHPEDPRDSITPSSDPYPAATASAALPGDLMSADGSPVSGPGDLRVVESIDGSGRTLVPVPTATPESGPR